MRYKKIGNIVMLLFMFFKRSVMNFGILKSKLFRTILLAGIAVVTLIMTILVYNLLDGSGMAMQLTKTIMDVYSLTTAMWSFIIFMYGLMVLFTIFSTFIGIVFVPKRENPISVINIFADSSLSKVIMWIYYIHLINILPLFGDGKMIIKALLTMRDV